MTEPDVTLAVPCRTDEPALGRTLGRAWASWQAGPSSTRTLELLVCLNGAAEAGAALDALRDFARARGVDAHVIDVERGAGGGTPPPVAGGLAIVAACTPREGKARAWNVLRARARAPVVVFLDADVDVGRDVLGRLLAVVAARPDAILVSARTRCAPPRSWFERVMAVPYGVDFPNLSPQLYAARRDLLPASMPEDLLDPERWLELTVGAARIVRAAGAEVIVRVPGTPADFFRQRVRIEMGRVQLETDHPALGGRGTVQPGVRDVVRALPPAALAHLGVYLAMRTVVHAVARRWYLQGRRTEVWRQAGSTKEWGAS